MSAHRDFQIVLTEEQLSFETVRTAFGIWNDVLYQLCDSAYQLRAIGEARQAEAMFIDAESMARRARQHLRNITARERERDRGDRGESSAVVSDAMLSAQDTGEPANDQHATEREGAA